MKHATIFLALSAIALFVPLVGVDGAYGILFSMLIGCIAVRQIPRASHVPYEDCYRFLLIIAVLAAFFAGAALKRHELLSLALLSILFLVCLLASRTLFPISGQRATKTR